ncbi:hypothetical protein [Fischerella sp. JS2]|uniref:hypothetical protein n=1 Tax=Fischerella sp. JS2 TaxID=2597771 RepID=UPI0028E3C2CB|nr:hypothetical protein [Fischerella sp. JS2]
MTITKNSLRNSKFPIFQSLIHALNGRWHKRAMQIFMIVILAHLSEHLFQGFQLWVLHWPRPQCLGVLGLFYPSLVHSEWLHYGHALFMLLGLALLRPAITITQALFWWNIAFAIQFWHHIEHALLLGQSLIHKNLYQFAGPVSIAQIIAQYFSDRPFTGQPWLPRIELHLFYNLIVLIPMLIALRYHRFPPASDV